MSTQELIARELAQLPESQLAQVLTFVQQLQTQTLESSAEPQAAIDAEFLQVYASVAEKRKEVFQRLADS